MQRSDSVCMRGALVPFPLRHVDRRNLYGNDCTERYTHFALCGNCPDYRPIYECRDGCGGQDEGPIGDNDGLLRSHIKATPALVQDGIKALSCEKVQIRNFCRFE